MQKSDFQMSSPVLRDVIFKLNNDFMPSQSALQIAISDAILLGYIRPLIAQLSGNAGFPPLHLPLLNLQQDE